MPAPPSPKDAPAGAPRGFLRLLADYGPRLAVFALLVGLFAGWLALRAHLRDRRESAIGSRLDRVLLLPEDDLDKRIAELRALAMDAASTEAEPWVLLTLGNDLYRKAESARGEEARRLREDAYRVFLAARDRHPNHAAAPLSLFSAACAAEQLGNATAAKGHLNDLRDRYPSTYLVRGARGFSLETFHSEELTERIQRLRKDFPEGVSPPPPPPPVQTPTLVDPSGTLAEPPPAPAAP